MGIQRDLKDTMRDTKNFFKGYSKIQVRLRQATSVDPWGPATIQMEEMARATHSPTLLPDLIYVFDRRLNDHGKYWRHVYKSLVVMEYCIVCGSESFVRYAKDTIYVIKTLKEFQYIDDKGRDQGAMVRQKSKEIVSLLQNEGMLADARRTKTIPRLNNQLSRSISPISRSTTTNQYSSSNRPSEYDDQLLKAMEESKLTALEDARRRASSDDAFFGNLQEKKMSVRGGNSSDGITNMRITQEQPKIILTQVPHTSTVSRQNEERESKSNEHDESLSFDFMNEDLFAAEPEQEIDPFANAEEVVYEGNPFEDAEEISKPAAQANSANEMSVPMPRNPYERAPASDSVGAKPVKPMNLTPGFSTRAPANNRHFNK